MNREDVRDLEALHGGGFIDGESHCVYIRQDLKRRGRYLAARFCPRFGSGKFPNLELHPFHLGGSDRLSA
jgi:hypothetical protein